MYSETCLSGSLCPNFIVSTHFNLFTTISISLKGYNCTGFTVYMCTCVCTCTHTLYLHLGICTVCSWTGLRNLLPLVPCVIYCGLILWRTLDKRNQARKHSVIIQSEVVHITSGKLQYSTMYIVQCSVQCIHLYSY